MAQRQQLTIYIPHRDFKVKFPILDLFRCHAHSQPLDTILRERRLDLEIHDNRRKPHASALLILGLEIFSLGGITSCLALAGRLQELAQLRRG